MARIDNDPRVRDLSRLLWEKAGRPNGFEHQYWALAARTVEGGNDNSVPVAVRSIAR